MRDYEYIVDDLAAGLAVLDLERYKLLGLDTETVELNPLSLDSSLRLVQIAHPEKTYVFDMYKLTSQGRNIVRDFLDDNERVTFILQNAKFDLKFLNLHLGVKRFRKLVDTMLAAQVLSCGFLDLGFGLEDIVQRYLGFQMDKTHQKSDWSKPLLSPTQIQYAAYDAEVLLDLWPVLAKKLTHEGLMYCAKLEFDAVDGIAKTELNGFRLIADRWRELCAEVYADWKTQRRQLQEMLTRIDHQQGVLFAGAPTTLINPNSQPQVIAALEAQGVPIPINDKTGRPTISKHKLNGLAIDYPIAKFLLDFKTLEKFRSSYGLSWLDFIDALTQRIHADFRQIGAMTGRMSCYNPNLQQAPRDPRFRRCFAADPGHVLVGGDYSLFELRILADYCLDPAMLEAFRQGLDFHTFTAQKLFGVQGIPTFEQRQLAKNNNFAGNYGASVIRFALMAGVSLQRAEEIMGLDRRAFPVKHRWLDTAGREAVRTHQSETRSGRIIKYMFDPEDRASIGRTERHGRNSPVQGTNADVIKRAVKLVNDELSAYPDIRLVHIVHDELQLECPDDPQFIHISEEIEQDCMGQAGRQFVRNVPVKVDTHAGYEWGK